MFKQGWQHKTRHRGSSRNLGPNTHFNLLHALHYSFHSIAPMINSKVEGTKPTSGTISIIENRSITGSVGNKPKSLNKGLGESNL